MMKASKEQLVNVPSGPDKPKEQEPLRVGPSDVVVVGCAVITLGAVSGAVSTYRRGSKSLMEDGINPGNRARMIPVAFKTLMLSTLFTGVLGVAGFYGLKSAGFFSAEVAELPSAQETARMLRDPKAYIREALASERGTSPAPSAPGAK